MSPYAYDYTTSIERSEAGSAGCDPGVLDTLPQVVGELAASIVAAVRLPPARLPFPLRATSARNTGTVELLLRTLLLVLSSTPSIWKTAYFHTRDISARFVDLRQPILR